MRKRVDVLMSRSKHTIPHAQSSPRVNLSIGARARQVQDGTGQEGAEPKTGNRETERKIKGCESAAREALSENSFHPHHSVLGMLILTLSIKANTD